MSDPLIVSKSGSRLFILAWNIPSRPLLLLGGHESHSKGSQSRQQFKLSSLIRSLCYKLVEPRGQFKSPSFFTVNKLSYRRLKADIVTNTSPGVYKTGWPGYSRESVFNPNDAKCRTGISSQDNGQWCPRVAFVGQVLGNTKLRVNRDVDY